MENVVYLNKSAIDAPYIPNPIDRMAKGFYLLPPTLKILMHLLNLLNKRTLKVVSYLGA